MICASTERAEKYSGRQTAQRSQTLPCVAALLTSDGSRRNTGRATVKVHP